MQKKIEGEKLIQTLIFPKLPSALWGFNKKECYVVHITELFLHQKRFK